MKLVDKLETYLDGDEKFEKIDVLTLVGTQTRAEKVAKIKRFLNGSERSGSNMNILCATSGVGNAGINCRDVRVVDRVDFPPSIADLRREYGRAGRRECLENVSTKHLVLNSVSC